MSDDNNGFELTRRRILAGVGTVGAASAATGAGTMALFSDTETSNNNTVQAGTLDLSFGTSSQVPLSISDIKPGTSGSKAVTLTNNGSLPGFLNFDVPPVSDKENGLEDPEPSSDTTADGELGNALNICYGFDTTGDGAIDTPVAETMNKPAEHAYRTGGAQYNPNYSLSSSSSVDFVVEWTLPSSVGNLVQGDSIEFDLTFELLQQSGGADVVLTDNSPYSTAKGFSGRFNPVSTESHRGNGAWQATAGDQDGLYFGSVFSGYHALPRFTFSDINEVSYWMKHSNQLQDDFYLQIFTQPRNDSSDFASWFNAKYTAVPPNANDGSPNWTPGQWNEFGTESSAGNQLYFYLQDNQQVSLPQKNDGSSQDATKTLQTLKSNPWEYNSSTYPKSDDEIKAMAVLTNSNQTSFTGYLDDIHLGTSVGDLSIDLEN